MTHDTLRRQLWELAALADTRRVQVPKTTSPTLPLPRIPRTVLGFSDGTRLARLDDLDPGNAHDRWAPAGTRRHAFDPLRAAALPPGVSRGALATAAR